MGAGLTDFTGKSLPAGYTTGPKLENFTGKPLPDGYTTSPKPVLPNGIDATKVDPAVLDATVGSKYPAVAEPESTIAGAIKSVVPKNDTDAAIQIAQFGMPFTRAIPGLGGLMGEGLGALASRIGLTTAAGAVAGGATGGLQGAEAGAEQGALGGALGEAPAPVGRAITGLGGIEKATAKRLAQSEAENVAQQAVERRLGMTAEQANSLARPVDIGEASGATALSGGKKAMTETREAWRRAIGDKYNPIFEPINNMPVHPEKLDQIGEAARAAQQTSAERGVKLSPSTQKMIDGLAKTGEDADKLSGDVPDLIRGAKHIDPAAKARFTGLLKAWDDAHPGERIEPEELRAMAIKSLGGDTSTPTIGQLRGKLGQLTAEANRAGSTAADRSALFQASQPIIQTLNDAVPDAMKPTLAKVNAEYAQVNKIFPFEDVRKLNKIGTLPELGKFAFEGNPKATTLAFQRMTPDQKELMRKAFASYVMSENTSQKELFNTLAKNKDNLKLLGFPDDFDKVETWRQMVGNAKAMRDRPPDLPSLKAFTRGMRDRLATEGVSAKILDHMDTQVQQAAAKGDMKSNFIKRQATLWGPMGMMAGYGWMYKKPEMLVPMAGYLARQSLVDNPAYRDFMLGAGGRWTRRTGDAFARLIMSSPGFMDNVKQAAAPILRPDKEEEADK